MPGQQRVQDRSADPLAGASGGGRLSGWRRRLKLTHRRIRSTPTGRVAMKSTVAILGLIVVVVGLALVPLPGPGWLIVIAGLAIWAVEFRWARRLLAFVRGWVSRWTHWVASQSWPVRIALGTVGLIFLAVVAWLGLKYSFGIDVAARFFEYIRTH